MKSRASILRLGLFALMAGTIAVPWGSRANEPPLLGAIALGPELDCLPIDPPPPVIKVRVRVPACGAPNRPIEYRICVENCSTAEAHHVILKNPLPGNAEFARADPEPTRMVPELQWNPGTLGGAR